MKEVYFKYQKQLDNAYINRALTRLSNEDLMIILRATEKRLGKNIPLSLSCGVCVMNLIDLFMTLVKDELIEEE